MSLVACITADDATNGRKGKGSGGAIPLAEDDDDANIRCWLSSP
jgi:hypothetical protein